LTSRAPRIGTPRRTLTPFAARPYRSWNLTTTSSESSAFFIATIAIWPFTSPIRLPPDGAAIHAIE
jgi:hypothetical protein